MPASSLTPSTSNQLHGRPRSARAHAAILDSAHALLIEQGYPAVTMDAIAARAGASKATIYRWWPNKAAVLMDAYLDHANSEIAFPDTGSLRDDLAQQLAAVIHAMNTTPSGRTLTTLIAEAQHDPGLAASLRERFIAPRRDDAIAALERGRERHQLRADVDTDVLVDLLYGALYYRLLVSGQPTDVSYANTLLDHLTPGLMPGPDPLPPGERQKPHRPDDAPHAPEPGPASERLAHGQRSTVSMPATRAAPQ